MSKKRFSLAVLRGFCFVTLTCLMLLHPGPACLDAVGARSGDCLLWDRSCDADLGLSEGDRSVLLTDSAAEGAGLTLVVTNTSEDVNGDFWDPAALIANPGPDGISLAEAMKAIQADTGAHETITFAPLLSGSVITVTQYPHAIARDGLTIDGDLDDDGHPDITIEGDGLNQNGLWIWAASDVVIEGLAFHNFGWGGIKITNNVEVAELKVFEDIVLRNNVITGMGIMGGIDISLQNVDHGAISNIEIVGNTIEDDDNSVYIDAAWGGGDNEISHVFIVSNTITGGIVIRAAGGLESGVSRNTVSDVQIRGNQINGYLGGYGGIVLDAANRSNCNDNTIRDVVIADNHMDVTPVTMEIVGVGENGWSSSGNRVENVTIVDNVLTSGGIQVGGATASDSNNNTISGMVIDRNYISPCAANGIFLVAGGEGAHDNLLENVWVRNNFVADCDGAGVLLHGADSYSPDNTIRDVKIANLTLVSNGIGSSWAGGLNINSKSASNIITGVAISNTILWENNFDDAIRGSLVPDSVAYSILNDVRFTGSDGNIYESPQFVDPGLGDYHLQASSPGVDTGDPSASNAGPLDLDKRTRVWDGDYDTVAVIDRGAWEFAAVVPQEIDVQGNQYSILSGDTVPVYWDDTDFGVAMLTDEIVEHTFTLCNAGGLPLSLTGAPKVVIAGIHAADFGVTAQPQSPVGAAESTTFTIAFDPSAEGLRYAVLGIANDDCDEDPYTFAIKGTGVVDYEPVHAEFSGSPTSGIAPLAVSFTNTSTGDYDTCSWTFGDSATSDVCSDPSHTYTEAGIYTVTLDVSGLGGSDFLSHPNYITVIEYRIHLPLVLRNAP